MYYMETFIGSAVRDPKVDFNGYVTEHPDDKIVEFNIIGPMEDSTLGLYVIIVVFDRP